MRRGVLLVILAVVAFSLNAQNTWYTLASGDWDNSDIWTLDPAGAIPVGSAVPSDGDNVIILSGKTVTVPDGVSPYDPGNDVTLTQASVTIYGSLDLRTSDGHNFSELNGTGRLLMAADNYPTISDDSDFVSVGEGEGTIVYYGDSFTVSSSNTFCNLEVDMTTGQTVSIADDITLNGNLVVSDGTLQINDSGTTALTIQVNGDVNIESAGSFTVGSGDSFHWLEVYGDFINEGSIDFSNSAQYAEATNGAVKLKFLGSTNNEFQCNGTTELYRLFVDKGSDKTFKVKVTADNSSNFSLYGPVSGATSDATDGTGGYQRLPVVIENGTLELGSNIVIDRMGENISGDAPNEFLIPESGRLWVNGASITTGNSGLSWQQNWNGLSLYGTLRVSAGSFTCPEYSAGISYYTPSVLSAVLNVEGGSVNIPQLVQIDGGAPFVYRQSGGYVNFDVEAEQDHLHPICELPETNSVFEMSGGFMVFSEPKDYWDGDIELGSSSDNYNVTGGTVEIQTNGTNLQLESSVPFYNLTTTSAAGSASIVNIYSEGIIIINDLSIGAGTTFNDGGYILSVGGVFNIAGTFSQTGSLVFNGDQDGAINNQTGSDFTLNNGLIINKDRHPTNGSYYSVSLTGDDNVLVDGNIEVIRGALDVVDYWPTVTDSVKISDGSLASSGIGGIEFTGSAPVLKGKFGKEFNFGNIRLNNGSNGLSIATNINVEDFSFVSSGTGKVNLNTYNLTVTGSVSNNNGSRYFYTDGNVSDGGLTLIISSGSNGANIQYFPVGSSTSLFTPMQVDANSAVSSDGTITVIPVDDYHPTITNQTYALDYYWRVEQSGLDADVSNIRYEFEHHETINVPTLYDLFVAEPPEGMVFYNNEWTGLGTGIKVGTDILRFPYTSTLTQDYTFGVIAGGWLFNYNPAPRTLYSRNATGGGDFDTNTTWSDTDHGGGSVGGGELPTDIDFCIVASGHTVTIDANNAEASQILIEEGGTLFIEDGTSGHNIAVIKGGGTLVYEENNNWATYSLLNADHSEFCENAAATIEFTGTGNPRTMPSNADLYYYPNLKISGTGTVQNDTDEDVIINGDLTVESGTLNLLTYGAEVVTVEGDVNIDAGTLTFNHTWSSNRYLDIEGDINFTGTGTFNDNSTDGDIYLRGSINQSNGTIDLSNSTIVFEGTESAYYTSSENNPASFNRLEINKSEGRLVSFYSHFGLNGSTSGSDKALEIVSGECVLDNDTIDIDLTTGGNAFNLPPEAVLYVTDGTVNASGDSGLKLEGSLIVNGGTANLDGTIAGGGNSNSSYIEFTSSGDAYLEVSNSGTLMVGDQIRRSTSTEEGVLSFVQNNATILIGTVGNSLSSTRGMFEVLGAGSSFSQADGDIITIERSNGSSTVPSLYFEPEAVSNGDNAGFTFDVSNETGGTFVIYAPEDLNNVDIIGGAGSGLGSGNELKLLTVEHTIDGDISIGSDVTFNANGLDLILNGDLTNSGTFTANNNTTYFKGASDQTITGNTDFADLIKETGSGALILGVSTAVTVSDDLTISNGSINTGTNDLTVEGDLINNGLSISSGASQGIVLAGSDVQQIGGSGTYDVLTINNSNGVVLPTQSGSINFTSKLRMVDGVFDIGRNLLVVDSAAVIEEVSAFDETNMIQTNLSFTDNGIQKYFPVISGSSSFTYPIGSLGKYTPITLDVTSNKNGTGSPGSIRVKAADEPHVSVPVADQGSVLQYNWTLDADDITGFSADAYMYSYDDDAVGDTSAYYTARILLGSVNWNKYSTDDFMGYVDATDISKFTFSNTNDAGIDGDYTAGAAIPDEVQAFISVADGPWTTTTTWATYDPDTEAIGTPGDGVPSGTGPKGAVVYIDNGDVVSMPSNFMSSYRTNIRETGILSVGSSFGHRLGDVMGTGTLKLENGDLPAGSYDNFFSVSGGVLEYTGSTNYDVLSELPTVNSVVFSGTGERRLPNIDVQLNGDLNINGPNVENTHDSDIALQGDLIFSAGTFDAGIGTSTITFNGSTLQSVSGAVEFTSSGGGEFYNLEIDNASGLDLQSNAEVINDLYLTTGNIESSSTSMLTITNTATDAVVGGSSTSYVAGPMQKQILNSSSFTFPVGYGSTYGKFDITLDASSGGLWEAEYIGISPGAYATRAMDPETVTGDVAYVSHSEFWRILAPGAANAQLTLYWGSHSGVNPDTDFRLVDWQDLGTDAWSEVSIGSPNGDTNSGNVSTSGNVTFNEWSSEGNYYTFGSIVIPAYTWVGDVSNDWFTAGNWSSDIVPTAGSDVTIVTGTPNNAEIDGVAQMNDLTISSGTLTLAAGSQVTINGDLSTINDGLIIQNTVTNPSSVITYGTVSGEAQVQRTGFTELSWYHIAHEVSGVAESEYDASIEEDTYALNRYTTVWERVGGINEVYSNAYTFDDELEGYSLLFRDAGETLVYSGTLNGDASYSKSSLTAQWHHMANPYPSYLDVEEVGFDMDNFMKTVYLDTYNGLVITYNIETNVGLNGGTRYIAPGQAFWLRNYVVSDFSVASSARAHSTGSLKSSGMDDENIFRMELSSSYATDEAVVLFGDNGSEEVTRLDSEKLMNSGDAANIYSLKASKKVAVSYLPNLQGMQEVVPLGYQVSESGMEPFTYRASNIAGFYPQTSVYLVDKLEGKTVNLRETPSYTFTPQVTSSNDRFELVFEQLTTDVEDITKGKVVIYGVNQSAFVKLNEVLLSERDKLVEVYNLAGQLIMQQEVDSSETELVLPKANTMYIIKASIGDTVYQQKIVTTN